MGSIEPKLNGHQFMAWRARGDLTLYPDVTVKTANQYNATQTLADNRAPVGTRVRIIGASVNNTGLLTIADANGTPQFVVDIQYNAVPTSYVFGPRGIQLDNGFQIILSNVTAANCDGYVLYELN